MSVYLLSGPFWQAALVQVADAVGVRLYRFFLKVAHKRVAQLGGHHVCHKVGIEEDALQEREKCILLQLTGVEEDAPHVYGKCHKLKKMPYRRGENTFCWELTGIEEDNLQERG